MSATINCAEFAEYFGTPIRNQMNPAYVFEVEGAPYTIEEFYLDDLKAILPLGINVWEAKKKSYILTFSTQMLYINVFVFMSQVDLSLPDDPCITEEMYNVAVSLIQSFDEMEAKDQR